MPIFQEIEAQFHNPIQDEKSRSQLSENQEQYATFIPENGISCDHDSERT